MNHARLPLCFGLFLAFSVQAADPPPARVVTAPVTEREVAATTRLTGVLDFDRISAVSGEISGLITRQHVIEGERVAAGDPLVELNTDLIRKDMDIKRKQRAQVTADLEKLTKTLQRLESLLQKNSASRQTYDDTRYDHRSLQKKRETLDEELQRLQLQLEKSTVRAPFDGIILEKLKESGEWLNPGTAVCRIASTKDLIVKVALSEKLVRYQTPGARLPVSIPAMELQTEGSVRSLVPVANLRSRSVTLKIALPYQDGMIQNMSASVKVPAGEKQRLQLIPRDALVRVSGKEMVYTVREGKAKILPVEIVSRMGAMIGIQNGAISEGMPVVVDGNDRLRPDQPVQIIQ